MSEIAKVFGVSRLRMNTDGEGVTTLVTLHGCPLRCKYCINPEGLSSKTKIYTVSAAQLYDRIKLDELYFLATGGGVTFGGGEPLLYPDFIKEFSSLCPNININIETSLNVPWENIAKVLGFVKHFYVDVKDCNNEIYRSYTGCDNKRMLENLKRLAYSAGKDKITARLPLIPKYNTDLDREESKKILNRFGITDIDIFTYKVI